MLQGRLNMYDVYVLTELNDQGVPKVVGVLDDEAEALKWQHEDMILRDVHGPFVLGRFPADREG